MKTVISEITRIYPNPTKEDEGPPPLKILAIIIGDKKSTMLLSKISNPHDVPIGHSHVLIQYDETKLGKTDCEYISIDRVRVVKKK